MILGLFLVLWDKAEELSALRVEMRCETQLAFSPKKLT